MRDGLPFPVRLAALAGWAALPLLLSRHATDLLVFTGMYAIAGLGVGLLLGTCGIVNVGQAAFYGFGAYASAYCTAVLGWPMPAGFVIGLSLSFAVALVIGRPILRLTGYFLALATLALEVIASTVFVEADGITGGTLGISGVAPLRVGGFAFDTPARFYYVVWPLVFVFVWCAYGLRHSRVGLAMRSMRDAPDAAMVMGIDIARLRLMMFLLCSQLGALAGSLFAHYVRFVSVEAMTIDRSITFLLIPVLGGASSPAGVVLGAAFVTFAPELLSVLGDAYRIVFGLALVFVVSVAPGGIAGAFGTGVRWVRALEGNRRTKAGAR